MKCENCGIEHNGEYSSRFCSKSCARQYSSKHVDRITLKPAICIKCGKPIMVKHNIPLHRAVCDLCKKHKGNRFRTCKICGTIYDLEKEKSCPNEFCHTHSIQQINSLIKYFGFDKSKLGKSLEIVQNEFNRVRNQLYDLYWNQNLSGRDIMKIYNYPNLYNLTGKIFRYLDIPRRTYKDASLNAYINGKMPIIEINNTYKSQWHTTWNNKEVYLRSSYELDYAKELDIQKVDYEVESLKIKYLNSKDNKYHCAIPDFYIPATNTIIEVKSNYTLDKQEMKDKFKAYRQNGYNCILLLEHKEIDINSI